MSRPWSIFGLGAMTGGLLICVCTASSRYESLLKNSPFEPAARLAAPVSEQSSLELRGMLTENGELLFSIHDKGTRSSRWVGLREAGLPYRIERYDHETGQALVSHHGKLYALTLPASKLSAASLGGADARQAVAREVDPRSVEAIAASWRGTPELDYLKQLRSPVETNDANE